jgi:hypothetical protein
MGSGFSDSERIDSVKRYELSEAQWARIALLLPGKVGDSGRTGVDNYLFMNGVSVAPSFWRFLAAPAGALQQVEERACPLHPLGQSQNLGEGLRRTDKRPRQ